MIRILLPRGRRLVLTIVSCLAVLATGAGAAALHHRGTRPAATSASRPGLIAVRTGDAYPLAAGRGRLTLVSFLTVQPDTAASPSRSQAVVLTSLATQYGARGLRVAIVAADPASVPQETLLNTSYDWGLESVALLQDPRHRAARKYAVTASPTSFLIGGTGQVLARWDGYLLTAKAAAAITSHLDSRS
ncbi:TlpA family protein disulfide reductase [Streptomyces sp. NPDC096311]|uniref:TlpA family protein disulfide reductase n=1 Tax=Streptomyces sp. NPDC096311 TaxID=3366083 RepID=UPI0037FCD211